MSEHAVKLLGMMPDHLKVRQSRILLDSLAVMTDIGFHDHEVGSPQRLLISVELWLDDLSPPPGDDPAVAWNYDVLRNEIIELAQGARYNLQETLVTAIYERVAGRRGVRALRVKSVKPDIYADAAGVGVEIASFAGSTP